MIATSLARALATALGLTLSMPIFALDLMQSYRDAQANDTQVASALAQLAATREVVPQARAGLLPQVVASGAITPQETDTNLAPSRNFVGQSYGVQLSFPLYRLQNVTLLEQSKLQASLGETQFIGIRQELIVRVAQAYFTVLGAQDNLETILAQKRAISEQLASAKRNFEVGTTTITDQQEAQARFDLTVAQELSALNDLAVARSAFVQLIGRPVSELEVLPRGVALQGPQPSGESAWVTSARNDSYSVLQAQIATEIARREIDLQRYAKYPTVDVVSSISHARNSSATFVGVRANTAAVGLQVGIPLYTGGAIDSRVRQAAASHDRALADLETARRTAEQTARQSFLGLTSGLAQVNALEAAERSSQLALDSNLLGYQVGVRINIDVLNAQQQLFTTRRDLSRARYDVLISGLQLKYTAGTLDEADLRVIDALLVPPSSIPPSAVNPSSGVPSSGAASPARSSSGRSSSGMPSPGMPRSRVPSPASTPAGTDITPSPGSAAPAPQPSGQLRRDGARKTPALARSSSARKADRQQSRAPGAAHPKRQVLAAPHPPQSPG